MSFMEAGAVLYITWAYKLHLHVYHEILGIFKVKYAL
jgi:hypothetical protein